MQGHRESIDACVHAVQGLCFNVDLLRLYSKTMRKLARSRTCAVIDFCNGNIFDDRLRVMSLQDIERTGLMLMHREISGVHRLRN